MEEYISSSMKVEPNKATVTAFYGLMFNRCEPAEAVRLNVGGMHIEHNPVLPDRNDAFIAYFRGDGARVPGQTC